MDVMTIGYALAGTVILVGIRMGKNSHRRQMAALSPADRERAIAHQAAARNAARDERQYGPLNAAVVCPQCHQAGQVRMRRVTRKKGVSGGKATAALLTGGVSLLATGLSRKEAATAAHCGVCHTGWDF